MPAAVMGPTQWRDFTQAYRTTIPPNWRRGPLDTVAQEGYAASKDRTARRDLHRQHACHSPFKPLVAGRKINDANPANAAGFIT